MKESNLRSKIIKRLREETGSKGWWFVTHGGMYQQGGIPDILGCYKGRMYGLEVKLPGKESTLTERQAAALKSIRRAKGRAAMITSVEQALDYVLDGIAPVHSRS